jgi:hypothetical protein
MYDNCKGWKLHNNLSISVNTPHYITIITSDFWFNVLTMFEVAYYIVELCYIFFVKNIKRNDNNIIILHHFITLWLTLYKSIIYPYGEFAFIYTLFTHNLCDVPLNLSLLLKNITTNDNSYIADIFTFIFGFTTLLFWIYLRLYLFGIFVYYTTYSEHGHITVSISLWSLYGANIYWFYLLLLAVYHELILHRHESTIYDK